MENIFNSERKSITIEDFQEVALKRGEVLGIRTRKGGEWKIRGRSGLSQKQYWGGQRLSKNIHLHNSKNESLIKREEYKGNVYCLTVPNGTLFVKKDGDPVWCGNCVRYILINRPAYYREIPEKIKYRPASQSVTGYSYGGF